VSAAQPAYDAKTWCQFWPECKNGKDCPDALNVEVRMRAIVAGLPCAQWLFPPRCFVPLIDGAGGHHA
jgi:hypothetical protein